MPPENEGGWKRFSPVTVEMDPTAGTSAKNPETVITLEHTGQLGVEVTCPDLLTYRKKLRTANWQLNARTEIRPEDLQGAVVRRGDESGLH